MKSKRIQAGRKFDIEAIDLADGPGSDCPAWAFLEEIRVLRPASHKSMTNVLKLHADVGPLRNEQKSRHLADGIYEFKSTGNDRLFYFFAPASRLTILTHGFHHRGQHRGKRLDSEIARAKALREQYYSQRQEGGRR